MNMYSYTAVQDAWTTHHLLLPAGAVLHGEHRGMTYVAVPESAEIPADQPAGISATRLRVTTSLLNLLTAISPHAAHIKRQQARRQSEGQSEVSAQAWADEQMAAIGLAIDPRSHVPTQVTMRQARAALILAGLMPAVEAALNAISDPTQKALALNEWERSTVVERDRGLVQQMAAQLGMTSAQLDALFVQAAQVP